MNNNNDNNNNNNNNNNKSLFEIQTTMILVLQYIRKISNPYLQDQDILKDVFILIHLAYSKTNKKIFTKYTPVHKLQLPINTMKYRGKEKAGNGDMRYNILSKTMLTGSHNQLQFIHWKTL